MITKEEVILAYQLMLGRSPESDDAINSLCQTVHSLTALRDVFLNSPEFKQRINESLHQNKGALSGRHPHTFPRIPVEIEADKDTLDKLFERTKHDWSYLGENEPYWSVITQPQYYKDKFDERKEEFYKSGSYLFRLFESALTRNGISLSDINVCLDAGCGVGRITRYMANNFERVIAADISQNHIAIAEEYLGGMNVNNIYFHHWGSLAELENLQQVDAIFSVITLQHNPPPLMAWMLKNLLAHLRASGVAFIQLPTYKKGYIFEVTRYLNTPASNGLEMHFLPQHNIFKIIEESDCLCLEVREDSMIGGEDEMLSNTFLIQKN